VKTFARQNRGLTLVTGPTGSGKTTTLSAMIRLINEERACYIITLEDPIEYIHEHRRAVISQREIHTDAESFGKALRSTLREDPDVILVGELRDPETMATAIKAAETGHLVFATLHTGNTAQTIDRIIDSFPSHQQPQIQKVALLYL
ncbi:MAG TPA: ATPase, T2SS/T4P/T4SS family, partial [Negativicutes bacterium]|nr:ATPase, T2SS/T4P/T4SS family [Negativicutes bacterium]